MGVAGYKTRVLFGDARWSHPTWTAGVGGMARTPETPRRAPVEARGE